MVKVIGLMNVNNQKDKGKINLKIRERFERDNVKKCYTCGEPGHLQRFCPNANKSSYNYKRREHNPKSRSNSSRNISRSISRSRSRSLSSRNSRASFRSRDDVIIKNKNESFNSKNREKSDSRDSRRGSSPKRSHKSRSPSSKNSPKN